MGSAFQALGKTPVPHFETRVPHPCFGGLVPILPLQDLSDEAVSSFPEGDAGWYNRAVGTGTLLTFVGNRDPYADPASEELGPILSLLEVRQFRKVVLFCTGAAYLERAKTVEEIGKDLFQGVQFDFQTLELQSVVDYEEIYEKLKDALDRLGLLREGEGKNVSTLRGRHQRTGPSPFQSDLYILLDPGTPQIQTCWFLLVRSGILPATLLQGVPPKFAGGTYKVREIRFDRTNLPRVLPLSSALRSPGSDISLVVEEGKTLYGKEGERQRAGLEPEILGEAAPFRMVLERAKQVATYDKVSVLILGETGTGKELIARLIHAHSPRWNKPFVPINCAAVSPTLVESELFGHVKGAYTGAERARLGQFRSADGGTIFLDEVGDLPLEIQSKLLRVLQDFHVQPVGSDELHKVDVRVLAATNQNLEELIEKGKFRRDLYERLNQVTLTVPPLRERKEDIPLLANHFLREWNRMYKENKEFTPEVRDILNAYSWPGNVRELQNTIIALCASAQNSLLKKELLPPPLRDGGKQKGKQHLQPFQIPDGGLNLKAFLYQVERSYYEEALRRTGGNRERAARLLGMNPPAFRKALRERFHDLLEEG